VSTDRERTPAELARLEAMPEKMRLRKLMADNPELTARELRELDKGTPEDAE